MPNVPAHLAFIVEVLYDWTGTFLMQFSFCLITVAYNWDSQN